MQPGYPSRTLLRAAIRRAAHQLLDAPLILRDPVVVDLVPEASQPAIRDTLDDPGAPDARLFRCLFAMRSRFAEDRLAEAAGRGVRQYVIVGAGLDTFPWRQPDFARDMLIFAADHPASLAWTQGRLRERGLPRPTNLIPVPVDLEQCRLGEQLAACGFVPTTPTFCSVLGVTQYLDPEAVAALLAFAAGLAAGSEIVLSFALSDDALAGEHVVHPGQRPAALGEPWKSQFRASDLVTRLAALGFRDIFHLTPELAQQRYFADRTDIVAPPDWEQLIAAVV